MWLTFTNLQAGPHICFSKRSSQSCNDPYNRAYIVVLPQFFFPSLFMPYVIFLFIFLWLTHLSVPMNHLLALFQRKSRKRTTTASYLFKAPSPLIFDFWTCWRSIHYLFPLLTHTFVVASVALNSCFPKCSQWQLFQGATSTNPHTECCSNVKDTHSCTRCLRTIKGAAMEPFHTM